MKYSNVTDKLVKLSVSVRGTLCRRCAYLRLRLYYKWMIVFINMQIEVYSLCCNCELHCMFLPIKCASEDVVSH